MWREVARTDDIAAGGMKCVDAGGEELCLCRYGEGFYAVSRRCGHQSVPLEQGALEGWVLTCPLHHAQFDIRSGRNLSVPVNPYLGTEPLSEPVERWFRLERRLQEHIRTYDLRTHPVRVISGAVEVDVPDAPTEEER